MEKGGQRHSSAHGKGSGAAGDAPYYDLNRRTSGEYGRSAGDAPAGGTFSHSSGEDRGYSHIGHIDQCLGRSIRELLQRVAATDDAPHGGDGRVARHTGWTSSDQWPGSGPSSGHNQNHLQDAWNSSEAPPQERGQAAHGDHRQRHLAEPPVANLRFTLMKATVLEALTRSDFSHALLCMPWVIPRWKHNSDKLADICAAAHPEHHRVLHGLLSYCQMNDPGRQPDLNWLPWNRLVRVVFSRAAAAAGVEFYAQQPVNRELNHTILRANSLEDITQLGSAIRRFAGTAAVKRTLTYGIPPKVLKLINTPGAWLLDTLFTMQLILFGDIIADSKLSYRAVGNATHKELLHLCRMDSITDPDGSGAPFGSSDNNRGNQTEHLAWLALEADRCDILLAMAYHARNIEQAQPDSPRSSGVAPHQAHASVHHTDGHHGTAEQSHNGSHSSHREQQADAAAWGHNMTHDPPGATTLLLTTSTARTPGTTGRPPTSGRSAVLPALAAITRPATGAKVT